MVDAMNGVTIMIPVYNEAAALPDTISALRSLSPQPEEILFVDGGSDDGSIEIMKASKFRLIKSLKKGRAQQINLGVSQATNDFVCVLHADSALPHDAVTIIKETLSNPEIALASFMPRMMGSNGTRWGTTLHNYIKTWYMPLFLRPHLFFKGVRLLFGDHAMFFRRRHFMKVDGCDERVAVMEEADLCIKLARFGKTKIIHRWVKTSDRRIVAWGRWRANAIYLKVGMMWAFGARERLADHYPDIR